MVNLPVKDFRDFFMALELHIPIIQTWRDYVGNEESS